MADQQYSLRWNNHEQNFITIFKDLLDFEELVDVTLSVEGKHIKAHKVVLSACSPYFKLLFSTTPCKHPIVVISDVKYSDLKTIIDFIYCGEISVYDEKLADILEVAKTLEIKGLYDSKQNEHHPENINGYLNTLTEQKPECNTSLIDSDAGGSEHFSVHIDPEAQSYEQNFREECVAKLYGNRYFQNSLIGTESNVMEFATQPILDSNSYVPISVSNSIPGRQRNHKVRNSENFILALEAVRSGKLGFCKAAKFYGLNNRTLWLEYKKRGYPTLRPPVGLNRRQKKDQNT